MQRRALADMECPSADGEAYVSYFSSAKPAREKPNDVADKAPVNGVWSEAKLAERPVPARAPSESVSTIAAGMLITGNITCEGLAQVFGRIVGDVQATQISIGDGAHVEGNIAANEVSINGAFKGTIRANNVRLKGSAVVDGEVFSKSLTVEENVQFEGVSRRLDKPIELPSAAPANGAGQAFAAPTETGSFAVPAA